MALQVLFTHFLSFLPSHTFTGRTWHVAAAEANFLFISVLKVNSVFSTLLPSKPAHWIWASLRSFTSWPSPYTTKVKVVVLWTAIRSREKPDWTHYTAINTLSPSILNGKTPTFCLFFPENLDSSVTFNLKVNAGVRERKKWRTAFENKVKCDLKRNIVLDLEVVRRYIITIWSCYGQISLQSSGNYSEVKYKMKCMYFNEL